MTLVDGSGWRHLVSSQCGTFQVVNAQKPKYLSSYPHGRTVAVTQRSRLVVKLFNFRNILHDGEQFYSAPYTITSGTAKHIQTIKMCQLIRVKARQVLSFFCHVPINAHTKSTRLLKIVRFTSCNIHPSVQRCTLIGEQPLSVSSPPQVLASRPIRRQDRIVCAVGHGTCYDKRTEEVRNLEILMSHLKSAPS